MDLPNDDEACTGFLAAVEIRIRAFNRPEIVYRSKPPCRARPPTPTVRERAVVDIFGNNHRYWLITDFR